jgi:hypothetical protein
MVIVMIQLFRFYEIFRILIRNLYIVFIFIAFCNEFDQRVAREQLCKNGLIRNNRGSCVFCRSDLPANRLAG